MFGHTRPSYCVLSCTALVYLFLHSKIKNLLYKYYAMICNIKFLVNESNHYHYRYDIIIIIVIIIYNDNDIREGVNFIQLQHTAI